MVITELSVDGMMDLLHISDIFMASFWKIKYHQRAEAAKHELIIQDI